MKPNDLNVLSSSEIDLEIDKREDELKQVIISNEVVEQERLDLQRQILELQLKKKGVEATLSKSSENMKLLTLTLNKLRRRYWAIHKEGR